MSVPTSSEGVKPHHWAILVWGCYLVGYLTAITVVVGVIVAYVKRPELAGTPFHSHMTSAIRTFWIGLAGSIIGTVLLFAGIGFVIWIVVALWLLFRSIRGLVLAIDGRPIQDPEGWL